ncbi:MAG: 50S ribosomal protein L23 [Candidatus Colwellbacteria bacterium]|nr:50S ribosomal protein L23 [Candidatus Colwellbacteria bacterium]MBI3088691.1 50S ribosomal protein L23 [Candidatus Colwellbacteria bacterium]
MSRLLIKRPIISEKATDISAAGKYVFLVHPKTNKKEIKELVEKIYKVHPVQVNIIRVKSKSPTYKKAVVTLKQGENIPDIIPT